MRRTPTERPKLQALLLAAAVSLCALPSRAQTPAERGEARAHFDRGLTLAKASDYEPALREFERAYALVPHHSVLYNIAQAELALGRNADAAKNFRRYLHEGGSAIEPTRRAEIEARLAQLEPAPSTSTFAQPAAPEEQGARSTPAAPVARAEQAQPRARPSQPALPRAASRESHPETLRDSGSGLRTVAYVVGGASVALAGVALGHYLWNRERYQDWQSQRQAYGFRPTEYRRTTTNDLARSISRASVVTVALCVGASVTLGTSVVLVVSSRPARSSRRAELLDGVVGLQGTF
jgi:hypothetical protein